MNKLDEEVLDEQAERRKNLDQQLELLLSEFSFAAASSVMRTLGIAWYNPYTSRAEVPSAIDLRDHAEGLLKQVAAMTGDQAEVHSGNLSAYRVGDDYYRIAFEIERASTEDVIAWENQWQSF